MVKCLNCGVQTSNPKFCSRSCSATYTNKVSPKRKLTRKCVSCNDVVKTWRHSLCEQHHKEYLDTKLNAKDKTLGEYRNLASVTGKHSSWANSHIRVLARKWNKDLTQKPCEHCGYSKHVELAHIKAVSEFEDTAYLRDVNSPDNLKVLCPNCHWEFDNLPRR